MAKFCPECAKPIIDGNMPFCSKCGARLPLASPEIQSPLAQPTTSPQPTQPVVCKSCGNQIKTGDIFCSKCLIRLPENVRIDPSAQQSQGPTIVIPKENRSAFEWVAIVCGGVILLVVVAAFIAGMAGNMPSASSSNDKIYTQDLSSMALTINDLSTGWKTYGAAVNTNDTYSSKFFKVVGLTANVVYLDISKYPTIDQAKMEYISKKAEITQFKVESVNLGNEGFGYVNDDSSIIVFRKGNIIVRTQYGIGAYMGMSFSTLSISDAKEYAKIVADRIR